MEFIMAILGILWFVFEICGPLFAFVLVLDYVLNGQKPTKERILYKAKIFFGIIVVELIGLFALSSFKKWWKS